MSWQMPIPDMMKPDLHLLPRTIRRAELKLLVPLADSTIYEMEQRGEFPRRYALTPRCVVWDLAEVQEWLARISLAATISGLGHLRMLADELEAESPRWPDWSAAEQAAWQARVQAALAPLAQNPGFRN